MPRSSRDNLPSAGVVTQIDPNALVEFRGDAARIGRQAAVNLGRQVQGVDSTTWMGPLQPISPFTPLGVTPRVWDYPVGINIRYQPRGEQPDQLIGFP